MTITPNIFIYIPVAGETLYDESFEQGMIQIDQHDHSGLPGKGLPIGTQSISDGSVTFEKLNADVVDPATGVGTSLTNLNQIVMLGLLKNIFQLAAASGFISKDGTLAHARTLIETANQIKITNPDGVGGNPVFSLQPTVLSSTQPAFLAYLSSSATGVTGAGTTYKVICDTILKNQPATPYDASTGIFTAPATGTYLITGNVELTNFSGVPTNAGINIKVNSTFWDGTSFTPNAAATSRISCYNFSSLIPLTLGDTVEMDITVSGMGGDTVDVSGSGSSKRTYFSGYLLF